MEPNDTRKETTGAAAGPPKSPTATEPEAKPSPAFASASKPKIPPILLEGDETAAPAVSGGVKKFQPGPPPVPEPLEAEEAELPEGYGTGRLLLVARDPHCLYAHWDPTAEEQHCYRDQAGHPKLAVRVYLGAPEGQPVTELPVHPESRHWFIAVEHGGANYAAELGCYGPHQEWHSLATSETVTTPRGKVAEEKTVEFATVPFEAPSPAAPEAAEAVPAPEAAPAPPKMVPTATPAAAPTLPPYSFLPLPPPGPALPAALEPIAPQLIETVQPPAPPTAAEAAGTEAPNQPTAATPAFVRQRAPLSEPLPVPSPTPAWTPSQEAALAELFGPAFVLPQPQLSSAEAAGLPGLPGLPAGQELISSQAPAISSPAGGAPGERKGFWFNVNAELVIYGATEADAQVTIGGQPIALRPDGTFSLRFALPDGQFELAATAISSQGERRGAELIFRRSTQYRGEVGIHPQDPSLKPPQP